MPAFTPAYPAATPNPYKKKKSGDTVAATNMGPRGFTDAQKAQINARMKKKMATVIKAG